MSQKKEFDWFDHDKNRKLLWKLLYGTCALTLILEPFAHVHGHFGWDGFFGFSALLGFGSCTVLIVLAKLLGYVLKVREDFYDR
ncbi:hypothetical protein [Desulfobaculum bizertense]|uniref:Uncharacterized protein n=1 Tax=Desulfobaculum bizertense DSM 18034 TaxID=1121442 RepID=A0A1T4W7D9_9BACT|nr:hypothetical protein [Desulfobaculum bizertense]UIJ39132.1 hypothetical protein LWC08_06055 [Desulfobaculum bizertense]SKA73192.1 hypothetical protein SAMN02745702_01814 [Desulfobaculum bizertense DSM 18034]